MRIILATVVAGLLATAAFAAPAMADSKMQVCAAQWQTMKKTGADKGTDYKTFSSSCLKGTAPAPVIAAKPVAMAKPAPAPVKVSTPAPAAGQTKMQQCAANWNALKAANKTGGQDYKTYSSNCLKGNVAVATPAVSMAKPASTMAPMNTGAKMSQQDRMKMCAANWNKMKASNSTGGQSYKQYSSSCLKTH